MFNLRVGLLLPWSSWSEAPEPTAVTEINNTFSCCAIVPWSTVALGNVVQLNVEPTVRQTEFRGSILPRLHLKTADPGQPPPTHWFRSMEGMNKIIYINISK